ncbi:hypothetical protein HH310_14720 [Actinoplanes sp. TBRC 11911]|uniref:DUF6745 domain-containing protein n=1 Tax=Actinoplanes sp. TBRC 11911 TaxID=2729386 RepID=UPI00145EB0B4|nr:hypothetical protein [Actinoplanes sp. TBRC 11911]NMO52440.1 hypothetical protein [Actinoplanes sp. TBRC 11911]
MGPELWTDAERAALTNGVRRCYENAGLRAPEIVAWASSPLAGERLAAELARRHTSIGTRSRAWVVLLARAVSSGTLGVLSFGITFGLSLAGAVYWLLAILPSAVSPDDDEWFPLAHARGAWIGAITAVVLTLTALLVVMTRTIAAVPVSWVLTGTLYGALFAVFGPYLPIVIGGWAGVAVSTLGAASGAPPESWISTLLTATVLPVFAVAVVVGFVVRMRTGPPAPLRYTDDTHLRIRNSLAATIDLAPVTLPGQLWNDPDRPVELAVAWAVSTGRPVVRRYPVAHFDTQTGHRVLSGTLTAAPHLGWWWPHRRFVVFSHTPTEEHDEHLIDGFRRPHRTDGPAISWPDGYRVYAVHGVGVPAEFVEAGWDAEALHRHPNTEVRRAAIELIGWSSYIEGAGWELVATAPDPGNPPHELALYEDPSGRLANVRVLVMTNGSPNRSGKPLRYAETVPDTINDPVAAAAWQYGCPVDVYRQMRRRT